MPIRTYPVRGPLDLTRTLAPLVRGPRDPATRLGSGRVWRTTRTPDGPASIALALAAGVLTAEAWGPGADRALDDVPELLALTTEPAPIPAGHPLVTDLARRHPGVRIPRTGAVLESLVPAILEQKVAGEEARRA